MTKPSEAPRKPRIVILVDFDIERAPRNSDKLAWALSWWWWLSALHPDCQVVVEGHTPRSRKTMSGQKVELVAIDEPATLLEAFSRLSSSPQGTRLSVSAGGDLPPTIPSLFESLLPWNRDLFHQQGLPQPVWDWMSEPSEVRIHGSDSDAPLSSPPTITQRFPRTVERVVIDPPTSKSEPGDRQQRSRPRPVDPPSEL